MDYSKTEWKISVYTAIFYFKRDNLDAVINPSSSNHHRQYNFTLIFLINRISSV